MIRVLIISAMLLASCASIARRHCETVYCAESEPVEFCEHIDDLVVICTEDRLEAYGAFWGWWAAFVDGVMQIGKAVAL